MKQGVWILGATGRTGRAIAQLLHARGVALVLIGRDRTRLERLAADLDGAPQLLVGTLDSALARLAHDAPAVVVNTVGPFTTTARVVAQACPPGTHYVDIANELLAAQQILELHQHAAATEQVFVSGAGFGVLATESVVLRLCAGQPPARRVRVDALASVATEPGQIGQALAATIVELLSFGGWQVRQGRLVRAQFGGHPARLLTPDGEVLATASGPSAELLAAWRASHADAVIAASSLAPTSPVARLAMPVVAAVLRIPGISRLAARRMARMPVRAAERPRAHSWAHARAEWDAGDVREGWLRAGDGMEFTAATAAEVACRLLRGEGRPGAYTPGALFGPDLAEAVGGAFVV